MSRSLALGGLAVALVLLLGGVAALWFLTGTGASPSTATQAAPPHGRMERAGEGMKAVASRTRTDGGISVAWPQGPPLGTGEPDAGEEQPAWAAAPLDLQAPMPDQIPCGDLDCLTQEPERYRTEVHGMLAREGLALLLADAGIEGEQAEELRAQLEANLDAFARGP